MRKRPPLYTRITVTYLLKVHSGCRLTFEEIAHDMKWRKPSSEENKVQSSYQLFLFKLRWVRRIWNFISNSFWKEKCWYLSEASPAIVMISYICTDIIVSKADFWNMVRKRAAAFQVWINQESWKFRTCTVKVIIFKHRLMVVNLST